MKKFALLALSAAILTAGCNGVKNTPEDVSLAFFTALYNADMKKAGALSTEKTQKTLEQLDMMMKNAEDLKKDTGKSKFEKATCVDAGENRKSCKCCCDEEGKEHTALLVKENGSWKVDMNKSELTEKSDALKELDDVGSAFDSLDVNMDSINKELDKVAN